MNYIYDIVSSFAPIGLSQNAFDVFVACGSLLLYVGIAFIIYKIVRIFF